MSKTIELLDKCKEKLNISSTYALSKAMQIDERVLWNYYNMKSNPDEFMCFKIAEVLEVDPAYVIAQIKSESEKNDKKREYFRTFTGTSRKIAANIIALALVSFILVGGQGLGIGSFNFNAVGRYKRKPNFA